MRVRMAVLSVAAVLLAACATTSEQTSYAPQTQKVRPQTHTSNDEAYMARVEAQARRRGVDVTWVHPPKVEKQP